MGLYFISLIIALPFAYLFLFKTTYWVKECGKWINKGRYKLKLWHWFCSNNNTVISNNKYKLFRACCYGSCRMA